MSGKRKPLAHNKYTSSSSGSDEDLCAEENHGLLTDKDELSAVVSPGGNSTASGPVSARTLLVKQEIGLKKASHTSSVFKGKKKKALDDIRGLTLSKSTTSIISQKLPETSSVAKDSGCKHNSNKFRVKKEPLPMKLRALPQSFWQQPNATIDISPGQIYAKLPPLLSKEVSDDIRSPSSSSIEAKSETKAQSSAKSFLRVTDTDWIFQLFDVLDNNSKTPSTKRGRPKKVLPVHGSRVVRMEDPVLGVAATGTIVPLPLSADKTVANQTTTLTMISLKDRDKSVSLPILNVEKNYSQILSEVVIKL
ncbi:hypothetical protein CHUAL_000869 [Chamberlinius hualienensis]